ncbi:DUF1465 family protein [Sphingomonas qilianensis]|uniref:DUF1465 family protein n=1 Tax=Sphingomonas qilianensis TaxID=1736690 RepID=A0ABU9XNE6_9SPHN
MKGRSIETRLHQRLIDRWYVDAMLLADEGRSYFDGVGRLEREVLGPMARVAFSCEALMVTTRLMHVIAWLLTQRAVETGELEAARRLGRAAVSETSAIAAMPAQAQILIHASLELYWRVARLDALIAGELEHASPARSMLDRPAIAF